MKLARFVALATVLAFGLSAFTPRAFGCGGTGMSGCREVAPAFTLLTELRVLVAALDALMP